MTEQHPGAWGPGSGAVVGGFAVRALAGDLTLVLPLTCPRCAVATVHLWFHEAGGFGGTWAWCSTCRACSHSPMDGVPTWWQQPGPPLDAIALTTEPDDLDRHATAIDAHVNALLANARTHP